MNKWDRRFLELAYHISGWSKDPSTKCGAVIVDKNNRIISTGYNGFPKGTDDNLALYGIRAEKYRRVIHAEKNAILFARQDLTGCTLYVVPMPPCSQCAGMIIQSGIKRVVTIKPSPEQEGRWQHDIITTREMFKEAGVDLWEAHLIG